MSWKPELHVEGKWSRNGLVFATKEEAQANARALFSRWTVPTDYRALFSRCAVPTDYRAVESDEPVNYAWVDGGLVEIK